MVVEHAPRPDGALDRRRREHPDFAIVAANDGAPMPPEGGVGEQLVDGDVVVDEHRGIPVGEIADAGRRRAAAGSASTWSMLSRPTGSPPLDHRKGVITEPGKRVAQGVRDRVSASSVAAGTAITRRNPRPLKVDCSATLFSSAFPATIRKRPISPSQRSPGAPAKTPRTPSATMP